jgi:predicted HTH domain antitoxin
MKNLKQSIIYYPADILVTLKEEEITFIKELKLLAAIKFYEFKKLSLGKAAELAEMDKYDFIRILGNNKISIFNLSEEELVKDIQNA